jgi:heparinase II/III-like protein
MSGLASIGRLADMDREELRFRVTCEARKIAGRLRYALKPPQWDRAAIAGVLDGHTGPLVAQAAEAARRHDYRTAHCALAGHFRTRASAWPLQARRRGELAAQIRELFPDALRATRNRADRIVDGRHDLLGYRNVVLGNPPDWQADAIHGRKAPLAHWAAVPYLDPASGDHKIIWETNRHQYFLTLGSAYWLTGDPRYRQTFLAHLEDWLHANPPLRGVNWSSMLELAFRAMSWTWALELFSAGAEGDETPWLVDLLVSLDRQLTHVSQNLSSYFSPNTHLSGEALALYAVSTAFPELRRSRGRAAAGRTILLREAQNQVRADGGHAELSPHYHRYSTDFYLLALMVARASGDAAAAPFEQAVRKQAVYLRTFADDRGRLPLIGDDDGGQLFRFGSPAPADASVSLGVAAALLADDSLAVTPASAETCWILGRPVETTRPAGTVHWPSRVLPESGYMVSRAADGGHLVFDAGPHGFLNGGHAHSDALAVVLTVAGEPLLVDAGTATYTMDADARDRFRSTRMHNTVVLDGQDHATPGGPFRWRTRADARFLVARTGGDADFAVGTHDAYGVRRHLRAVLALHGLGWLIVDRVVTHQPTDAQIFWHLHPDWRAAVRDGTVDLRHVSGRRLAIASTAQDISLVRDPALCAYAPEYGRLEQAATLVARHAASTPFVVGTFVPATAAGSDPVAIAKLIEATSWPDRWTNARFAIRTGDEELHVTIAFPAGAEAQPRDDWPQPCITRLEASRIS